MKLSRERCIHLSHMAINAFEDDDRIDFRNDTNEIRLKMLQILEQEMAREEEVEELVRRKITSQKRDIPVGSSEWEVLFRKYYEEEVNKIRRVRE
jgi:hypothetical protein